VNASLAGDALLLTGGALLVAGVLLAGFAERFRAPGLILFLGLGMLIGDDGLGLITFADAELAQSIAVLALVVILYEGGLSTSVGQLRRVAAPAGLLATLGVVVTAAVVSGGVVLLTDLSTHTAVLIGAVVASTDAAAVFAVLRRAPMSRRMTSLLEAESGANDPMAVLLTIGVLAAWTGDPGPVDWVLFGLRQLLGGLAIGAGVGLAGAALLRRLHLDSTALYPVLGLGIAGLAYGISAALGASGFLAVYVAALAVGAAAPRHRRAITRFHDGLASVAQIALFLLLGLLVFPGDLPGVAGVGLLTAVVLIVVARPLAVAVCLPWFGFDVREMTFTAWAGLRGAVPIVLATFPLTVGFPDGILVFELVFFVVLVSAVLQGFTIGPLSRRLGLDTEARTWDAVADLVPLESAGVDVIELEIKAPNGVAGRSLRDAPLPGMARVAAILRDDRVRVPDGDSTVDIGDTLIVVAPSDERLPAALTAWAEGPAAPPSAS
jgi:potassium/hydrogen antiporter